MKKSALNNSIRTLKQVRNDHHSQLDMSIVTELDTVIAELEAVDIYTKSESQLTVLGLRALQVIGIVISVVSNIKDLMK